MYIYNLACIRIQQKGCKKMLSPQTILITGASSGIGKCMALCYAAPNQTLYLIGRDLKRLQKIQKQCELKGATVFIATLDVTNQTKMAKQIILWDTQKAIDLVHANAGIGFKGVETAEKSRTVFDVNLTGVLNTIDPILPRMKHRKKGQVALMSSLASFRGMPGSQSYSASKAAVRFLGEALRPEYALYGVEINVICPGFIRTPLTDVNQFKMPFLMEATPAAALIVNALKKNKARIAFPWQMYWIARLLEILPNSWTDQKLLNPPSQPEKPSSE